jgi:hypothetical protein
MPRESKPITRGQARLIGIYMAIALVRQVAHDIATIQRGVLSGIRLARKSR